MTSHIIIKREREKPILQGHPWIFSGAIHAVKGDPEDGSIVTVTSQNGAFLVRGYWNSRSQIQVRILTWQDELINEDWWRRMIRRAVHARQMTESIGRGSTSAYRAINAESDYLPGLIVDVYDRWAVLQALTLGIDQRKEMITKVVREVLDELDADFLSNEQFLMRGVYERSDVDVRGKEGLKPSTGVLWGEEPPENIIIQESRHYLKYAVDVRRGHKTGFYLDQRVNRSILLGVVADDFTPPTREHRVLNLFSYTGGFGVAALHGGFGTPGHIINVDASKEALALAKQNFEMNFQRESESGSEWLRWDWRDRVEFIQADVFDLLREYVEMDEKFDVIVCDPPKFAHNAGQVDKAARGYKDLNRNCFKLINPGGYLMTFSCSGALSADLFQKIVFGALVDSGRQGQIVRYLGASDDHPVALTFPEGAYLKGLLIRVF